jgi:hypothetical protein
MAETRKSTQPDHKPADRNAADRKPAARGRAEVLPPQSPNDRKSADSVFRGVAGRPPEADFPDESIAAAESARPDLPDENEDGLDEMTAEVQRQAERGPAGVDGRDEDPDSRDEEPRR